MDPPSNSGKDGKQLFHKMLQCKMSSILLALVLHSALKGGCSSIFFHLRGPTELVIINVTRQPDFIGTDVGGQRRGQSDSIYNLSCRFVAVIYLEENKSAIV